MLSKGVSPRLVSAMPNSFRQRIRPEQCEVPCFAGHDSQTERQNHSRLKVEGQDRGKRSRRDQHPNMKTGIMLVAAETLSANMADANSSVLTSELPLVGIGLCFEQDSAYGARRSCSRMQQRAVYGALFDLRRVLLEEAQCT